MATPFNVRGVWDTTISAAQHRTLNSALKATASTDKAPTFVTSAGKVAPIWPELTLAAKGVAEHVVPRSHGGSTTSANLTNACSPNRAQR